MTQAAETVEPHAPWKGSGNGAGDLIPAIAKGAPSPKKTATQSDLHKLAGEIGKAVIPVSTSAENQSIITKRIEEIGTLTAEQLEKMAEYLEAETAKVADDLRLSAADMRRKASEEAKVLAKYTELSRTIRGLLSGDAS